MPKTKPIPVRIPVEMLPRLDQAAERLGTNRASLIAFCVKTFLEDFEQHGKALMPINWKQLFARMDGRTKSYGAWPSRDVEPKNDKGTKPASSKH